MKNCVRKVYLLVIISLLVTGTAFAEEQGWGDILERYRRMPSVRQLILVKYEKGTAAKVQLLAKTYEAPDTWTELLVCDAYIGRGGLWKSREGDMKTPAGDYGIIMAGGFKDNPGTNVEYLKFDEHTMMNDRLGYNLILDDRIAGKDEENDYFYDSLPSFSYSLLLDYNKECEWGRGSGIFLHCMGEKKSTGGCIAVREENMKFILQNIDDNARICIYPLVM